MAMVVVSFVKTAIPATPFAVIGRSIVLVPAVVAMEVPVDLTWKKHIRPTTLNRPETVRLVSVAKERVTVQVSHLSCPRMSR